MLSEFYRTVVRKTLFFEIIQFIYRYRFQRVSLKNRTVLISGVAAGLGRGLALLFSKNGYTVIGLDIVSFDKLDDELKKSLHQFYHFDLCQSNKIESLVKILYSNHTKIDIVINNAASMNFKQLHNYRDQEIYDMINVKLLGTIMLVKYFLPFMSDSNFGRIINISSSSAYKGEDKFGIYSTINGGLLLFTDSIAKLIENKLEGNVTINTVAPHRIATPEYLRKFPDAKVKQLISIESIFHQIETIIKSNVSGGNFLMVKFHLRLEYFIRSWHRLFLR